jgi:hypothetical protein
MEGEADCQRKFDFFLKAFECALLDTENGQYEKDYIQEYTTVLNGYNILNFHTNPTKYPNIGLVTVVTPDPLHYYSLFSITLGYDIIAACYSKNRYEVEIKYSTTVDLISRKTLPRVDMHTLAKYLNTLEDELSMKKTEENSFYRWCANSLTDSGPQLRLDDVSNKAKKVDRYASPFEREIFSSQIPTKDFLEIVVSYFTHAYQAEGAILKKDWTWPEYHDFNSNINWKTWKIANKKAK